MRRFQIGNTVVEEQSTGFQENLAAAYRSKLRPVCLCRTSGVAMYIASVGEQLVIKRMPLTGGAHAPECESYEPPYELSGLGSLIGSAIQIDAESGVASLKLDFSLSKKGPRTAPTQTSAGSGSAKNDVRKMSLRALLHYLWHQGGLAVWTAHWAGKRHWPQVRNHLLEAARTMSVRGEPLANRLFVPEPFRLDDKFAIEQRRHAALAPLHGAATGSKPLMVLICEIKEFTPTRSGQRIIAKHLPGFSLFLEEALWRRLNSLFPAEFDMWKANETCHLIAIATIGASESGAIAINEIALMVVTEQWLPVENTHEARLLEQLTRMYRKTIKGLRFHLATTQPFANAMLPEQKPCPAALYIVPPGAGEEFEIALQEMIDARPDVAPWLWRVADGDMPPLP
ncbi:DUF1173 domain-containing protein [Ensifer sp. YR511]|uniref:DUF1173 domain-containing protein n=1 Tax=Ensifer sp. YR511 TaxID=1855294 RepID=UPI000880C12A|nr:DUF1173 domain-containing protein [Ensifer sp. YR511]SDN95284.1 Protein of unknown function [Ensifer sp. YR511]